MSLRALLALVLVAWTGVAAAQSQSDPIAFVRSVYREYEREDAKPWTDWPYTARMRKLIDDDERNTPEGEVGKLDWDPIINAQAWKLSGLNVSLVTRSGDRAVVDATFHNLHTNQHIRFSLAREGGQWAIDDLQSLDKPRWTMSKIYLGAPDAFPDRAPK